MEREKVIFNVIIFVLVLIVCSYVGNVEKGKEYFTRMEEEYGIELNIRYYGCMVDMLGRVGFLIDVFYFVEKMKIELNVIIWRILLGVCRVYGNVELGRKVNEELLRMR